MKSAADLLGFRELVDETGPALLASSIGAFVEWYDFSLFGAFADIIGEHFFPAQSPTSALRFAFLLFFVGFVSRPLGALVFGSLGDRHGRIPVLVWSSLLMIAPTLCIAIIPSYRAIGLAAPGLLVVCRVAQGLSLGGEAGGGIVFALESVEPHHRAKMGALFQAAGSVGSLTANLFSGALRQTLSREALRSWGWKVPFYAGLGLVVLGAHLRASLRETAHAGGGRAADAPAGAADAPARVEDVCARARRGAWLMAVLMLWMVFGFYSFVFVPAYLTSVRQPALASAYSIAGLAQLCNVLVLLLFAAASDALERGARRRDFLVGGAALCALAFPLASLVLATTESAAACALAMLATSCAHAVYGGSATPYVFAHAGPAQTRLSTLSLAHALSSTLFAGTMPSVCEAMSAVFGSMVAPGVYVALAACVSAAAVLMGEPPHFSDGDARDVNRFRGGESSYLQLMSSHGLAPNEDGALSDCGVEAARGTGGACTGDGR